MGQRIVIKQWFCNTTTNTLKVDAQSLILGFIAGENILVMCANILSFLVKEKPLNLKSSQLVLRGP